MLTYTRARTQDVRALAGAIVLGSGAGFLVGVAYLAGGHAAGAVHVEPPPVAAGQTIAQNGSRVSASTNSVVQLGALRDRFRVAGSLTQTVARPFQFQQVADAPRDLNCLAQAVYFEARGEATDGQKAVAQVVLNRVRHPAFPKTICAVVHQRSGSGCQFTFACRSSEATPDSSAWRRAQDVARAALHGAVMGAVGDATHFQTAHGGPFAGLLRVAQVGAHVFYRFAGHDGSTAMFRQTPTTSEQPVRLEMARLEFSPKTATSSMALPISRAPDDTSKADPPKPAVMGLIGAMSPVSPPPAFSPMARKPADVTLEAVGKLSGVDAGMGSMSAGPSAKPVVSAAMTRS